MSAEKCVPNHPGTTLPVCWCLTHKRVWVLSKPACNGVK